MVRRLLCVCISLCVWSAAYGLPNNDDHAYTLNRGEWQLGFWDVRYGMNDRLELSSTWLVLPLRVPNVHAKWRFYEGQLFSASAATGVLYVDTSFYDTSQTPFTSTLIPTSLTGTWNLAPFFLSANLVTTLISTTGSHSETETYEEFATVSSLTSALNVETTIFRPALYWDRGNGFAWLFDVTFSLSQQAAAQGDNISRIDHGDRVIARAVLQGSGQADLSAKNARNYSVSALWYWTNFHLKLGLSMGHLMLPYINVFAVDSNNEPISSPLPRFDLYWRF